MLHEPGWIHGVLSVRNTCPAVVRMHDRLVEGAPHGDMVCEIRIKTAVPVARASSQVLGESSVNGWIFFILL